jgi:hypothetical protein
MTAPEKYPYLPKSNASLMPGQYWGIPLSDGRFAAGVVVAVPTPEQAPLHRLGTRLFVAGLLAWAGHEKPTAEALTGRKLATWGYVHVRSIDAVGGEVLGRLEDVPGRIPMLSHRAGGQVRRNVNGIDDGVATPGELQSLPVEGTWGLTYSAAWAESVFVRGLPFFEEIGSPLPHSKVGTMIFEDGRVETTIEIGK